MKNLKASDLSPDILKNLKKAKAMHARAYAPFSKYKVGAVLKASSGDLFEGCNIENASFGATLCAERVALGTLIVSGAQKWESLFLVTGDLRVSCPCGLCLQALSEFVGKGIVYAANQDLSRIGKLNFKDLFPFAFELKG